MALTNRDLCTKAISPACFVKIVLNRSFIPINSLIPCVFALPESEIIFRAKVSNKQIAMTGATGGIWCSQWCQAESGCAQCTTGRAGAYGR